MTSSPDPAALDVDRERVVQALCHHFAHDRLDEAELERRLGLAHAARTAGDLDVLLAGLPAASGALVAAGTALPAARASGLPSAMPMRVGVLMSEVRRDVVGDVPARLEVRALMGEAKLDLTHGRFGAETVVDCVAVMATVKVLVPPGVRVVAEGLPVMATFASRDRGDRGAPLPSDAPVLRLRGVAFWAEVRAKVARG